MNWWVMAGQLGVWSALVVAAAWLLCCVVYGLLVARWSGSPRWLCVLTGVLVPVLGPVVVAVVVPARRPPGLPVPPGPGGVTAWPGPPSAHASPAISSPPAPSAPSARSIHQLRLRRVSVVMLAAAAVLGLASGMLRWVVLDLGLPAAHVPWPGDAPYLGLLLSGLVILGALATSFSGSWIHLGAIVALPVGVAWCAAGVLVLLVLGAADAAILAAAGDLHTIGDVVVLLGMDRHRFDGLTIAGVDLPLSAIPLDGPPSIRLGTGWLLAMVAGALLVAWSVCVACWPRPATRGSVAPVPPGPPLPAGPWTGQRPTG